MASPIWIPELLEQILLNLDMQSQCVCHFWQNVITGSRAIQQDLFLRPIELRPGMQLEPRFNPLLHGMKNRTRPVHKQAFFREEASWLRMLIRQPPTFKLGVITPGRPRPFLVQSFRKRNDGLRLALLFSLVEGDILRWDRMGVWSSAEICSRLLVALSGDDAALKEHLLGVGECDVAFYTAGKRKGWKRPRSDVYAAWDISLHPLYILELIYMDWLIIIEQTCFSLSFLNQTNLGELMNIPSV